MTGKVDPVLLRARVGMVFQKPNPFPKSIYENVAYGPRIHGLARSRAELDDIVFSSLDRAGLYAEVKDRMDEPGTALSGGQQQRLCIARTIAVNPEVILMDEPCSALDPIATAKIEDLMEELSENFSIAIVTHSMQQAARVSQRTAYFHLGYLVEVGDTNTVFTNPIAPPDRRLCNRPYWLSMGVDCHGWGAVPAVGLSGVLHYAAYSRSRCCHNLLNLSSVPALRAELSCFHKASVVG